MSGDLKNSRFGVVMSFSAERMVSMKSRTLLRENKVPIDAALC
jgi:hypothetical protein